MKRFLITVLAFALPLALVLGTFSVAVARSGEGSTLEEVAERMTAGEEVLYGTAYRYNARNLKFKMASQTGADLLVLGSSRSMQFRREFFKTDSFYNAGGGAGYSNEYLWFLSSLPEDKLPTTLILQFDQFNFEPYWSSLKPLDTKEFAYEESPHNPSYALRKSMVDWAAGKYSLSRALSPKEGEIGLAAIGQHSGFRSDGSYDYGELNNHPEKGDDPAFSSTLRKVHYGLHRFHWSFEVSGGALQDTEDLLVWCAEKGIKVVGIFPPYAPSVVQAMQESGNYYYMDVLPGYIAAQCELYGFEFYDFTLMESTTDQEYQDGYHGSDRVYCKMALTLAQESTFLKPYLDASALEQMLETQTGLRGFVF